uniref:Uncharacterized protein n=1 Tax=Cupriavidus pinatubonensis (strain JMP 134 / LMG 1197) TaxID=264198 RepID=Q46TI2_CUPPJ
MATTTAAANSRRTSSHQAPPSSGGAGEFIAEHPAVRRVFMRSGQQDGVTAVFAPVGKGVLPCGRVDLASLDQACMRREVAGPVDLCQAKIA